MKTNTEVLFAVFEASPFISTGGLGDVGGALPSAIKRSGCNIKVVMPKFKQIPEKYKNKMQHVADFKIPLSWRSLYCGIEKLEFNDVTYYFVDNEYYFYRDKPYGFLDDGERIAYFCKAVLESIGRLPELDCNVLHCNDWHTSLIPVLLREQYQGNPQYGKIKTMFTIHNIKFQGVFPKHDLGDVLGLEGNKAAEDQLAFFDSINYLKGALCYSDFISTVSPNYAKEIMTSYFGEKMEGIFHRRESVLFGILNGIDTKEYNPMTDQNIPATYEISDRSGKKKNKQELQKRLGLNDEPDTPLIVMISRLTEQKGIALLLCILEELLNTTKVQVAVLGTGDACYEGAFADIAFRQKGKVSCVFDFSPSLSHLFYAGGDLLVMPSRFEPCGLSQMIAMRYGTLPVVRETGGLKDSVIPFNEYTGEGNGFSFKNYNAHELLFILKYAISIYNEQKEAWNRIVTQAMSCNFGWEQSATKYIELYERLQER